MTDQIMRSLRRPVSLGLFVVMVLGATSAFAAGSGSTHGPTAPGGDWAEPEYRDAGDMALFMGPGAYIAPADITDPDPDEVTVAPGADVSLNLHLGNNVALTGRTGMSWHGAAMTVPALGGIRLQAPFGASTVAIGPEVGMVWAVNPAQEEGEPASYLTGAVRASYEYTYETGWTVGADLSINHFVGVGTLPRAGVKLGYEF